ncbi:MAG: hypothetical protein JW866_00130 [Ignavibacteriales bacterium]|nr:hypothetical protein [Ignavibacteriales bacterium]
MEELDNIQKIEKVNQYIKDIQNKLDSSEYITHIFSEFIKPVQYLEVSLPDLNVYLTSLRTSVDGHFYHKNYKDFRAPYVLIHNNVFKKNKIIINEDSLAHELQHYFDWRDGIESTRIKNILNPEGGISSEYYNNPGERRAYTIQYLRQYFQKVKLGKMPDNFVKFYNDFFKKTDGREYYQYLSLENRQTFNNYLQEFYNKLLERKYSVGNIIREEFEIFLDKDNILKI